MIQANELRIGNWVKYINDRVNFIVSEINSFQNNEVKINGFEEECIEPIKLTKDFFVKNGFEKASTTNNKYTLFINGYCFVFCENGEVDFDYLEYSNIANIRYVHELQNFYFCLTGKELIVLANGI